MTLSNCCLRTCLTAFSRCLRAISNMTRCRKTSNGFTIDNEGLVRLGEKYLSCKNNKFVS